MLERFAVVYAPSASALAAIQAARPEPPQRPKTLVAFGVPIVDSPSSRAAGRRSRAVCCGGISRDAKSTKDGVLQMGEIMRLKLNADLVTLSACSTDLGKLVSGEGILGLTRAFFYAGARNVAVTLWNVNDSATAELMKAFYGKLNRGQSKAEALRQAKLVLLSSKQPSWRHPYFWAAFVLVGEGK